MAIYISRLRFGDMQMLLLLIPLSYTSVNGVELARGSPLLGRSAKSSMTINLGLEDEACFLHPWLLNLMGDGASMLSASCADLPVSGLSGREGHGGVAPSLR